MNLPKVEYHWRVTEIHDGTATFRMTGAEREYSVAADMKAGDTVTVNSGSEGSVRLHRTDSAVKIRDGTTSGFRSRFYVDRVFSDSVQVSTRQGSLLVPLGGQFFFLQAFDSIPVGEPTLEKAED